MSVEVQPTSVEVQLTVGRGVLAVFSAGVRAELLLLGTTVETNHTPKA